MLLEEPTTLMDVALMGRAAVVALSLAGARLEAATSIPANETPAMVGSAPVCAVKRQVTFCPAAESRLRRPVSAYARLACPSHIRDRKLTCNTRAVSEGGFDRQAAADLTKCVACLK
jgi:hypothetical protein